MTSRRRVVVIPIVLVIVIALAAAAVVWFRSNQDVAAVTQDRQGPVLLVPGRNADSASLVDLQRRLFLAGRRVLIVSTGIDDTGDLRAQAEQIQLAAERMIEDGAPSVDIVGYSAGAIVAQLWLANGGKELTRRVVLIGSPQQGVDQAQVKNLVTERYCATTCPQLAPESALLKSLPQAQSSPVPWLNLWTTRDRVVTEESAQVPGALNIALQSICPKIKAGHVQLPSDPVLVGIVLKALDIQPVTAPPTRADCSTLRESGTPAETPGVAAS